MSAQPVVSGCWRQETTRRAQPAARDEIEIERQRRIAELDMWKLAQHAKREVHQPRPRQFTPPPPRKKPIIIDGIEYESRAAAAAALGITPQAVSKRAKKANE